jgi:hypothetical protein
MGEMHDLLHIPDNSKAEVTMSIPVEFREKAGMFLYRFAWSVELLAAAVGISLAWLFLFIQIDLQKQDGNLSPNDWMLAFVAAIPFVMVAVIELTKIPLAFACYLSTSRMSKYLFGITLFLISIITFETFTNGFGQYIQVQLKAIKKVQHSMVKTENEIKNLNREKGDLAGLSRQAINDAYTNRIIKINKMKGEEIQAIDEELKREQDRLGGPKLNILQAEVARLRIDVEKMENNFKGKRREIEISYDDHLKEVSSVIKESKSSINSKISDINQTIKDIRNKIDKKENEIRVEEGKSIVGDTAGIRKAMVKKLSNMDQTIKDIRNKIDKKENEIRVEEGKSIVGSDAEKRIVDKFLTRRKKVEELSESRKSSIKNRIAGLEKQVKDLNAEKEGSFLGDLGGTLGGKIESKKAEIDELSKTLMNSNSQALIKNIDADETKEISIIQNSKKAEKENIITRLQGQIKQLKDDTESYEREGKNIMAEGQANVLAEQDRVKTEKQSIIERLQDGIKQLKEDEEKNRDRKQKLENSLRGVTLGAQRNDYLRKKNSEISLLEGGYSGNRAKVKKLIKQKEADIRQILTSQEAELIPRERALKLKKEDLEASFAKQLAEENSIKKKLFAEFELRDSNLHKINSQLTELNNKYSDHEEKLAEEAEKNPIGQWSIFLFGNAYPENIRLVSLVWFGSIAAITAWTGTVLAFGSLVLRFGQTEKHKRDPSNIERTFHRLFVDARKYLRKPRIKEIKTEVEKLVEVIKEVPVDRVVIQEVPREVIRKEVIHVPIATDDLTILDINNLTSKQTKSRSAGASKKRSKIDDTKNSED